jgi:hypothetical protein
MQRAYPMSKPRLTAFKPFKQFKRFKPYENAWHIRNQKKH